MATTYKPGQVYRLRDHVDYQSDYDHSSELETLRRASAIYCGPAHPLFKDQEGIVLDVVPAEEEGAGDHDADCVVLMFKHHNFLDHGTGNSDPNHEETDLVRNWSVPLDKADSVLELVSDFDGEEEDLIPGRAGRHMTAEAARGEEEALPQPPPLAAIGGAIVSDTDGGEA